MNQAEIFKELILNYQLEGGDVNDVASIIVYITAHKPSGTGRINEVIVRAILKQLGVTPVKAQPMIEALPPAIIEAAPEAVIPFETVSVDPVSTYDFGEPPMPPMAVLADAEPVIPVKPSENKTITPEAVPVEVAPNAQAPKGFWSKMKSKFWK